MSMGFGLGKPQGNGGYGNGLGGDDSNSGPKGKLNPSKNIIKAPSNIGSSGMVFSAGETKGAPDASASGSVPYTAVISNYKKAAENALNKEKVPPAYRNRVKDYFSSLEK